MAKAIFVGIDYNDVQGCQNLEGLPFVYAKSMVGAMTEIKSIFVKQHCLFFTDHTNDGEVKGVKADTPTKENVTEALRAMVSNARKGDVLLFYYCGHGANEYQTSRGALKTLSSDLSRPNVIYSPEFYDIIKHLPAMVNLTILIHACFSGAMFSYTPAPQRMGLALTSVGPDVPAVVRKEPDSEDFTTYIRDKVVKKLPDDPHDPTWPSYTQVYDGVKTIIVKGKTPDGKEFVGHADMYHDPKLNPDNVKFLQPIP